MWNDGKEEATDQVVNLALVRSLVDPSTREEGTRGRKKEEEEGDGDGWKRAGRRQSDVKADRRPVTPSHVSITPSICRESLHFFFFFYPWTNSTPSTRPSSLNSIINEGNYI